jgi:dCMP deaminase
MTKDWRDPVMAGSITTEKLKPDFASSLIAGKIDASKIPLQRKTFLDRAFDQALLTAQSSRDPSTKVGAAIYRPDNTLASAGYNGFPRGVKDLAERYDLRATKYLFVVHAEMNALLTAREPLHGYKLISTAFPCATCAGAIIQAGIAEVYAPMPTSQMLERWGPSIDAAKTMFHEAGVRIFGIGPEFEAEQAEQRRLESEANDRANEAEFREIEWELEAGEAERKRGFWNWLWTRR